MFVENNEDSCCSWMRSRRFKYSQVSLSSDPLVAMEENLEELWEEGTQKLRVDLLVSGEVDDYKKYRAALTRHKDGLYADFVRSVSRNSHYITVEDGAVKAFKYQLANPRVQSQLEVFRDGLIAHTNVRSKEFERSMRLRHPIFVMAFIISPSPCDLPLGMYVVESPLAEDRKSWRLRRHEDLFVWPPVPPVDAADDSSGDARPVAADVATEGTHAAPPSVVPPMHVADSTATCDVRRSAFRGGSHKFIHNGDEFDSMLECIHREAFRRMGLRYLVTRNAFQIGHLLPEQTQRMYTTDGTLYAAVGCASGPLQVFHVEVKPGPLTVEEGERCRALCQFLNQNVLCVSGGHVSDSQISIETSTTGSGVDYAQLQRFRPCVEMCLYAPQGVDAAPLLYPAVVWHFGDGSSTPFLSMLDHSNSRQKEDARLRLLHIYHQATKDATKFSRRSEPY
jgi:hypothetical protein